MSKRIYIAYCKKYSFLFRDKEAFFVTMLAFLMLGVGPCSQEFPDETYAGKISSQGVLNDLRDRSVTIQTVNLHHGRGKIGFYSKSEYSETGQEPQVGQELFVLEISHFKSRFQTVRSFDVAIPLMRIESIHLKLSPAGEGDYIGTSSDGQYEIHMSYQPLSLELITKEGKSVFRATASVLATNLKRDALTASETEMHFTSDELVERALKWNTILLEKHEEVIQAQAAAQSALARLLPHFTLGTIMEAASFSSAQSVFNLTGDLIPFVFPDNWCDQRELTWQYRAAKVAQDLFKSQLITQIQSLSVDYIIYTEYKERLQSLQSQLRQLMASYTQAFRERKFLSMSQPNWGTLEFESDQLENESISVQERIEQNRSELAKAIGVTNPKVISTLSLSPGIIPFERIPVLNPIDEKRKKEAWAKFAAEYSLEVRQQEYLKFAALAQEKGFLLHWLNPSCKSEYSIGFHLTAEKKIIKSHLRVFDLHISDLKEATQLLTYYWVRDRNVRAQQAVRLEQRLRGRLQWVDQNFLDGMMLLESGRSLTETYITDLTNALYQSREALMQYYSAKSIAMVNQLYLDRIAFRGQHAILKKHLDHAPASAQLADLEEELGELVEPKEEMIHSLVQVTDV